MNPFIICLIHCPRTGGASTIRALREDCHLPDSGWKGDGGARPYYGGDTFGLGEDWKEKFSNILRDSVRSSFFCAGHFPYGVNDYLKYDNFHYISLVRHPIQRVWSRYNTYYNAPNHIVHEIWKEKYNLNIMRILQAKEPEFLNDQVRLISGTDKVDIGPDDYANALYNVCEKFDYVTVTERIPGNLLNELHQLFPQIRPGYMGVKHNTVGYGTIGEVPSKEVQNMILENNKFDLELYNFVAKYEKVGISFRG
jgi:hypothetical protein